MNRITRLLILALATSVFSLSSCKKNDKDADASNDVSVQSEDQSMFSAEEDAVSNDANFVIDADPTLSGRTTGGIICDATVSVDTTATTRVVTITYSDTSNCFPGRKRSGVVTITMQRGMRWKEQGATIDIAFVNFKVTRTRDNKSVVLNGSKTITNVTGGLLRHLAVRGPIVHTITSNGLSATFDNGTSRQWFVAKRRTFTYNNGIVISTAGTHNDGTNTDVSVWGTNRLGQAFSTRIIDPMVVRQDCSFRLVSGKLQHTKVAFPITVTFGLDINGAPTTCPAGLYYFKAEWTGANGTAQSIIRPY